VGDVAFLDGELYAVIAGGGCGHGNPDQPNMVAKVDTATGRWKMVADMSAAIAAHPAANMCPEGFQPDGDVYSLIAARVQRRRHSITEETSLHAIRSDGEFESEHAFVTRVCGAKAFSCWGVDEAPGQ